MRGNRNRDTRPELAVRSAVHALGLRYRVAARPIAGVRRSADLVFRRFASRSSSTAVSHGCPDHFVMPRTNVDYWSGKIGRNRARDAETDALLAEAGWTVVRVWEDEARKQGRNEFARSFADDRLPP